MKIQPSAPLQGFLAGSSGISEPCTMPQVGFCNHGTIKCKPAGHEALIGFLDLPVRAAPGGWYVLSGEMPQAACWALCLLFVHIVTLRFHNLCNNLRSSRTHKFRPDGVLTIQGAKCSLNAQLQEEQAVLGSPCNNPTCSLPRLHSSFPLSSAKPLS